jgi:hypothetical protein
MVPCSVMYCCCCGNNSYPFLLAPCVQPLACLLLHSYLIDKLLYTHAALLLLLLLLLCNNSYPFFPDVHAMVCVLYEDARAMAPNGQPALVFPHRQSANAAANQQQPQLQARHEQLRQESDSLRAEAEQQQQAAQGEAGSMQYTGSMQAAGLGELDLDAVLAA